MSVPSYLFVMGHSIYFLVRASVFYLFDRSIIYTENFKVTRSSKTLSQYLFLIRLLTWLRYCSAVAYVRRPVRQNCKWPTNKTVFKDTGSRQPLPVMKIQWDTTTSNPIVILSSSVNPSASHPYVVFFGRTHSPQWLCRGGANLCIYSFKVK